MNRPILDEDGKKVSAGDTISFSYGIPGVGVRARVEEINGALWAMTPGHKPDKCKLSKLRAAVGNFYKVTRPLKERPSHE